MAKGDKSNVQSAVSGAQSSISDWGNLAKTNFGGITGNNAAVFNPALMGYRTSINQGMQDYGNLMGNFNSFLRTRNVSPQSPMGNQGQFQPFMTNTGLFPGQMTTGGNNPQQITTEQGSLPRAIDSGTGMNNLATGGANLAGAGMNTGLTGGAPPTNAPSKDFGNLSDPSTWMGLVGNTDQLKSWLSSANPQLSQLFQGNPGLLDYYAGQIQKSPGANPTEQAGSAQYWIDKAMKDPGIAGGGGGANLGLTGGSDFGALGPSLSAYGNLLPTLGKAASGYGDFAMTGGFSPEDINNIREQSIAPIRSIYGDTTNEINRNAAIQGPYALNKNAALAKNARDMAYATSDVTTNAAANIAKLQQQGKLAGLSGLSGLGLPAAGGLASAGMGGLQNTLGTLNAMTGLYGTAPGLAGMFGNQVLGANSQNLQAQALLNQLGLGMGGLNLGLVGANTQAAGVPGDFAQAMGNVSSVINPIGTIAGLFT